MKNTIKYVLGFFIAMSSLMVSAQLGPVETNPTGSQNHIITKTYKVGSQIPLSSNNPDWITTAIQYFDGLGRANQSVIVKGGASSGYGNNSLPYDWSAGTPTNSGFFNLNGGSSENQIVNGTTPFDNTDLLWECIPDGNNNADGGWNSDSFDIDNTKAYRYTLWVKRTGSQSGRTYHGVQDNVSNLNGVPNSNPYYWNGDLPQIDTWYLMVGYIHPYDYSGGDIGISGVYDTDGNKVLDGLEFKWTADSSTKSHFRSYLYYTTSTNVRQYFWSPVVQKIDGSEDALSDIVSSSAVIDNQAIVAKDIVTHIEYDNYGKQQKEYLPYASDNMDGRFEPTAKEDTESYYYNNYSTDFPSAVNSANLNVYSETVYENSPLNRVLEQTAPGEDWKKGSTTLSKGYSNGHTIKQEYGFNTGPDQISLVNHDFSGSEHQLWTATGSTYLSAGMTVIFNGSSSGGCTLPVTLTPSKTIKISADLDNMDALSGFDLRLEYDQGSMVIENTVPNNGMNTYEITVPATITNPVIKFYVPHTSSWGFYLNYFDIREKNTNYAATDVSYFRVATTLNNTNGIYDTQLIKEDVYVKGDLSKGTTKDENWQTGQIYPNDHTSQEYTDKLGRVVLKRTFNQDVPHETFYVYDVFGNLTYVLPPKIDVSDGVSSQELSELAYQYKYDQRKRLVEKKIPGKGWEYIVYNSKNQIVLTQDANQRVNNKWLFTKYDKLERVAYTGEYISSSTRASIQTTVNGQSEANLYEDRVNTTPNLLGGEEVYYTYKSFPNTTNLTVYTINYYDNYIDLPIGLSVPTVNYFNQDVTTNIQGLATVSKVRVLTTNDWITTATYYDEKARPIYLYSQNDYLQTTDIIESKLDFTGKVLETKTTHQKQGIADDIETIDRFEYDHMDRLVNQTRIINDKPAERLVQNNYDDLGQLKSKLTGNGTAKGYTSVSNGVSITNDVITKTGFGDSWYEGLATTGTIQDDGYVQFSAETAGKFVVVGLSTTNPDSGFSNIEHAIYLHSTNVFVFESGSNKGSKATYQIGDVFKIERIGAKVYYRKNGEVIYTSEVSSSGTLLADVSMFHVGVKIKNLHIVDNSKGLQNVDYAYNVRGWLKSINDDNQDDNDLFNFSLRYNDPTTGNGLFNGNISQTHWSTTNTDSSTKTYTYTYDALNRITNGLLSSSNSNHTNKHNLKLVEYDKNGNILKLRRNGYRSDGNFDQYLDHMTYYYSGNKLTGILEEGHHYEGFADKTHTSTSDYTYDVNGNMISDANKGIASIQYNHLNLPTSVSFPSQQASISYVYDATGVKQKKVVTGMSIGTTTTEYAGNYIYENNILQFFSHGEGYVKHESSKFGYVYQYKDHLGNVRLTYSDDSGNGKIEIAANTGGNYTEIIEESNYYPFGLKHKGYNNLTSSNGNNVAQKSGFGGKEFQDELNLNWYDVTARNYDVALGRWMNLDPLAEKMRRHSPYNFAFNNPIYFQDYDGMAPTGSNCDDCPNSITYNYQQNSDTEDMHTLVSMEVTNGKDNISENGNTKTTTSYTTETRTTYARSKESGLSDPTTVQSVNKTTETFSKNENGEWVSNADSSTVNIASNGDGFVHKEGDYGIVDDGNFINTTGTSSDKVMNKRVMDFLKDSNVGDNLVDNESAYQKVKTGTSVAAWGIVALSFVTNLPKNLVRGAGLVGVAIAGIDYIDDNLGSNSIKSKELARY